MTPSLLCAIVGISAATPALPPDQPATESVTVSSTETTTVLGGICTCPLCMASVAAGGQPVHGV